MKTQKRSAANTPIPGSVQISFQVSELQSRVLFELSQLYQANAEPNQANMASVILSHALMDFDLLLPRMIAAEKYCLAEGIEIQQVFRESAIAKRFPKKKPRRKSTR